jgi:hypothetical protein
MVKLRMNVTLKVGEPGARGGATPPKGLLYSSTLLTLLGVFGSPKPLSTKSCVAAEAASTREEKEDTAKLPTASAVNAVGVEEPYADGDAVLKGLAEERGSR